MLKRARPTMRRRRSWGDDRVREVLLPPTAASAGNAPSRALSVLATLGTLRSKARKRVDGRM